MVHGIALVLTFIITPTFIESVHRDIDLSDHSGGLEHAWFTNGFS